METVEITERTTEFLNECKKAGYEKITIFIADERVPCSVFLRKFNTGWNIDEDGINEHGRFVPKKGYVAGWWGKGNRDDPFKVVCGHPEKIGPHPQYKTLNWPAIWGIVKRLGLNHGGGGHCDGHDVNDIAVEELTAGFYDLAEMDTKGE